MVDTNVLVYAYAPAGDDYLKDRAGTCSAWDRSLIADERGVCQHSGPERNLSPCSQVEIPNELKTPEADARLTIRSDSVERWEILSITSLETVVSGSDQGSQAIPAPNLGRPDLGRCQIERHILRVVRRLQLRPDYRRCDVSESVIREFCRRATRRLKGRGSPLRSRPASSSQFGTAP